MSIRHDFERLPDGTRRHLATWIDGKRINPSRLIINLYPISVMVLDEGTAQVARTDRIQTPYRPDTDRAQGELFGGER